MLRFIPLVANFGTFIVANCITQGLISWQWWKDGMWQICLAFRESDGQFACWINVPNENIRQCLVPGTACVPCLDYCCNFVEPWHGDGRTGFKDNDRARIRRCDLLDQSILLVRQRKTRQVHVFGYPLIGKDDYKI